MYKSISFLTLIILFLISAGTQTKAQGNLTSGGPFQEADRVFTFGEDPERDKQSFAIIERSMASEANNYQWLWRAARALYFIGDEANKSEKLRYFEKGIDVGLRATSLEPNAVEGHFWLGVNYGGYSEQKGVFKALVTVKKIRAEMETVLRLNDKYQDGGAYLALGEMDRQLPRIIGGNIDRAITRLEQGSRIAPNNLDLKFALAEAYQEAGRKEDARREYQAISQRESRNNNERRLQEKARQKLSKF